MMREVVVIMGQTRSEQRFGRHRRVLVQELAARAQQRVVGELLRQCVLENIFDIPPPPVATSRGKSLLQTLAVIGREFWRSRYFPSTDIPNRTLPGTPPQNP